MVECSSQRQQKITFFEIEITLFWPVCHDSRSSFGAHGWGSLGSVILHDPTDPFWPYLFSYEAHNTKISEEKAKGWFNYSLCN